MRIVSLVASATEIVCALGAEALLVGRSHECDNPPSVRALPRCTEPAFDTSLSSGEIDAEVRRRLRTGEPLYLIDAEVIAALQPDLLISQSHCEVCAVTPDDVERSGACTQTIAQLARSASCVADIFAGIALIADALDLTPQGSALIQREQASLDRVRAQTMAFAAKTFVLLEWTDPLFAAGNWAPELAEYANGRMLLGHKGEYSAAMAAEELRRADPEFLIVAPCGFSLDRALAEQATLEGLPWWAELRAVRLGQVYFADGNLFFNRSGMTISETAEILAEILHGCTFSSTRPGRYVRYRALAGSAAPGNPDSPGGTAVVAAAR